MEETLSHALCLAAEGFWIFPCSPGAKTPAIKGWQTAATRDPDQLKAWFERSNDNVGIFTERFGDDEALIVVDLDVKNGKNGNAELLKLECTGRELPETKTHTTPSGGKHLIFRAASPVRSGVDVFGPGLDIRSRGALIVGPGSRTPDGEYGASTLEVACAPDWLVNDLRISQHERDHKPSSCDIDAERAQSKAQTYLLEDAPLAIEGQGGDATTYRVAARLKDIGCDETAALSLLLEHWNDRCAPPWAVDDLATKVRNAYEYGKEPGGIAAPENDFPPIFPQSRWNIQRISELSIKSHAALIEGVLGEGGIAGILGVPGASKTFNAVHLSGCVAAGMPWFDRKVSAGPCLYIDTDGGYGTLKRFKAWQKFHSAKKDVPLFVLNGDAFNVRSKKDLEDIAAWVRSTADTLGRGFKLIVVDTLNQSAGGMDENAAKDMAEAIAGLKWLRDKLGVAVIFVHHLGKDASKGARGHSSLNAAVDVELVVSGDTIKHGKPPRHYEPFAAIGFGLEQVNVTADDGQEEGTCVIVPRNVNAAREFAAPHIKADSVPGRALTVLEDLWYARKDNAGIAVVAWRDDFSHRHYPGSRKTGWNSFDRARAFLVVAQRIRQEGDYVFLPD